MFPGALGSNRKHSKSVIPKKELRRYLSSKQESLDTSDRLAYPIVRDLIAILVRPQTHLLIGVNDVHYWVQNWDLIWCLWFRSLDRWRYFLADSISTCVVESSQFEINSVILSRVLRRRNTTAQSSEDA